MTSLKEGDKAPFFKGINQDGKEITIMDKLPIVPAVGTTKEI